MNLNEDALRTIRMIRIHTDPIPFRSVKETNYIHPTDIHQLVKKERLERIEQQSNPTDSPIKYATWGDTAWSLQQSSLENGIFGANKTLTATAVRAFEEFAETHNISYPSVTPAINTSTDEVTQSATKFRRVIAAQQHQIFINTIYDDLPKQLKTVPKAFWTQHINSVEEETLNNEAPEEDTGQANTKNTQVSIESFT